LQTDTRSLKLIKIKSHLDIGKTSSQDQDKKPVKDVSKLSKPSILNSNLYKDAKSQDLLTFYDKKPKDLKTFAKLFDGKEYYIEEKEIFPVSLKAKLLKDIEISRKSDNTDIFSSLDQIKNQLNKSDFHD